MKRAGSKYVLRSNMITTVLIVLIVLIPLFALISVARYGMDIGYLAFILALLFISFLGIYLSRKTKIVLTHDTFRFQGVFSSFSASWRSIWWLKMTFELPRLQRYSLFTGRRGTLRFEINVNDITQHFQISSISPNSLNPFLQALSLLTRRPPKVVKAHTKSRFTETQTWRWE